MNAHELMTANPVSVQQTALLEEVEDKLFTLDVRHIPVVQQTGELVGILSDRDLREYTLEERSNTKAAEAMQGSVLSASPDTTVSELIEIMIEHRVGAIPIVAPLENRLVGIVSYIDILRAVEPLLEVA